jgi:hypothetical protein
MLRGFYASQVLAGSLEGTLAEQGQHDGGDHRERRND